jgi:phage tail tape-measure protein
MQADSLVQTLKPEQMIHVDERKLTEAQVKARDMDDILVTEDEAGRRQQIQVQDQQQQQEQQQKLMEANLRKILSDAFKNIAQGQKNTANADAQLVDTALGILEKGMQDELTGATAAGASAAATPQGPPAGGGLAAALAAGAVGPGANGAAPVPGGPPAPMPNQAGQGVPQ